MTRSPKARVRLGIGGALLPLAVLLFDGNASSNAPAGYYTLTTNTALDTRTKLRWMRGYAIGGSGSQSWASGAQACQGLTLDGFTGWRLPTTRELESIYDPRKFDTNMWDTAVFQAPPGAGAASLWSSTEVVGDPTMIEARNYFARAYNTTSRDPIAKTANAGARCVRDP